MSSEQNLTYGRYLQLDKLLDSQQLESEKAGKPAHHELFFITVHQTYELWFKQILFELDAVILKFTKLSQEKQYFQEVINGLTRINKIQALLNDHIPVLETLSAADFLSFRDLLTPASGFQSLQFRLIEVKLGLYDHKDLEDFNFYKHFDAKQQKTLLDTQKAPSLFEVIQQWLKSFFEKASGFFKVYQAEVNMKLSERQAQVKRSPQNNTSDIQLEQLQAMTDSFSQIFNEEAYAKQQGRLSYEAFVSALYLYTNQDQPKTAAGFQLIQAVIENDELLATWRYRHCLMVQRIIGSKVGTGGTSGYNYLKGTVEANRVFSEYTGLASYLISDLYVSY